MFDSSFVNSMARTDLLPPMTVTKKVKDSDKWKKAVMDSFEQIAIRQIQENLSFFDHYRMVDGEMTYQELSEVAPGLSNLEDLLSGAGVPTFLKHYDITSIIVNTIVDKYVDFQDKFHVTDSGEIAQNDYIRHKDEEFQKLIEAVVENTVNMALAEAGMTAEGKQFQNQEEQQAYMQQLEEAKQKFTPKDTAEAARGAFKTAGVKWGEATLDLDKERFNLLKLGKENLRDYLTSGRCFREHKIYHDTYKPKNWSPKNTFFSKEIEDNPVEDGEYVGRMQPATPSEVIAEYGHKISTDLQKELLGGNTSWKNYTTAHMASGSIEEAINSNFSKIETVPFKGYHDYNFMLGLQDELDTPMGIETVFNKDGSTSVRERYLPRMATGQMGIHNSLAYLLRTDIKHRTDLCQVTEAYFIAKDLWGYLTYEDPQTGALVTEEVTEDILPEFLKEHGIKQNFKQSLHDIIDNLDEVNTLKWQYRDVCYYGVKIQSANLKEPIYIDVTPMSYQIKGDSDFKVKLPVAGKVGKSLVGKILPFQAKYNLCMNQIGSLIEKELGMVLLFSTDLIPSEYEGYGDAEDALMALRNTAKTVGLMPVNSSLDSQKNMNNMNPVQTINMSHAQEISSRVSLADFFQKKAYELIGINPILNQPTKYETAEGVRIGNETNIAQISGVHEEFTEFNKGTLEIHLAVAQYCQANKKDQSVFYTKDDASIAFLKMSDPDLPLRRLGLIATFDSKRRKEIEMYKTILMNNNTIGADTLELGRLIGSDSWSEVIEIARLERENKQQQAQQAQQQQQQMMEQQAQQQDAIKQKDWERLETSKQKDREANLERERIQALGRTGNLKEDPNSLDIINAQADQSIKSLELNHKTQVEANNFKIRETQANDARNVKLKELELKARELDEKAKSRQSSEYIASINKN
jgi:hypothetical protein